MKLQEQEPRREEQEPRREEQEPRREEQESRREIWHQLYNLNNKLDKTNVMLLKVVEAIEVVSGATSVQEYNNKKILGLINDELSSTRYELDDKLKMNDSVVDDYRKLNIRRNRMAIEVDKSNQYLLFGGEE